MRVTLLSLQDLDEGFNEVSFLQEVAAAQALVSKGIDEGHRVFQNSPIVLQQQLIDDLPRLAGRLLSTVKDVVVGVREDDLPERLLLPRLGEPPPEGLQRRAHLHCLIRRQHEGLDFLVAQGSQRRLLRLVHWRPLLHQLDLPRHDSLALLLKILLLGHLLLHG